MILYWIFADIGECIFEAVDELVLSLGMGKLSSIFMAVIFDYHPW